jgi:hypothetical protein
LIRGVPRGELRNTLLRVQSKLQQHRAKQVITVAPTAAI